MQYILPLARLMECFRRLPGIGPKTAQRLAYHILETDREEALGLAEAIVQAKESVHCCSVCFNLTDCDPCQVCADPARDRGLLCVVEDARDVAAMERTGEYHGLYHVLQGVLSPLEGIGPEQLRIRELLARISADMREIIIATNPTVEGEATALYLARLLKPLGVKVSRIAHGLPVGGELEFADDVTLSKALENRREL